MPKLPGVVDKLDAVDEAVRGFYVEQDGKFVLDADVESHPTTTGLKNTVKALRGEKDLTAKELKAYRDLGYSPDQIAEIKAKADQATQTPPDLEKILAKRLKEQEDKFAPVLAKLSSTEAELKTIRLNDTAKAAALKAGMLPEDVEDEIEMLVGRGRLKLDDHGKVVVIDDDGDPMIGKTVEKWFGEDYKAKKPKVFAGTGTSGAGTKGSTGGGSGSDGQVIRLTREQASNATVFREALKKVGGDYSRIKVVEAAA